MEGEEGGGQGVQTKPSQGVWPVAYTSNCQMRFITGELGLRFDGQMCLCLFGRCCGPLLWNRLIACVCECACACTVCPQSSLFLTKSENTGSVCSQQEVS